jgi:hypothetical protein
MRASSQAGPTHSPTARTPEEHNRRVQDFEAYVASVARAAWKERGEPQGAGTVDGELEGLTDAGTARLLAADGESQHRHAGYLLGHLIRWLNERGWPVDDRLLVAAWYGASVATPEGQGALGGEDGIIRVHVLATLMTERKLGGPLADREERMLYAWLCEQAGVVVTAPMVERVELLRAKRHATSRILGG